MKEKFRKFLEDYGVLDKFEENISIYLPETGIKTVESLVDSFNKAGIKPWAWIRSPFPWMLTGEPELWSDLDDKWKKICSNENQGIA